MRRAFPLLLILAALAAALAFAACDDEEDGNGVADGDAALPSSVAITLQEWAVVPDADTAAAGDVTFTITNDGPADPHEFVVVQTDLAPDALPTADDGSVDEAGEGVEVIDEVEEIEVGADAELSVNLAAGSYVLLCNIVEEEEGELESHYQQGMRTGFSVE
ncbi:MAG: hypothetical protein WD379_05655 [Dehalococcoidia bacterium]